MLVDLGRNDIGRIAQNGSVEVTKYMEVEFFRYVMHLTSVVKGAITSWTSLYWGSEGNSSSWDRFGCSQDSSHEANLWGRKRETRRLCRGYWLSLCDGDLDFAIAIRTMILKNKKAYVQAGAGIVYDSIAENEYQETVNKAKSMTRIGEEGWFY